MDKFPRNNCGNDYGTGRGDTSKAAQASTLDSMAIFGNNTAQNSICLSLQGSGSQGLFTAMTRKHCILVAGKIHAAGLEHLAARPDVEMQLVEAVTHEAYLPFLPAAEALLIRTQPLTAADMAMAPHLRIVSRHGVGYDAVDVAALSARNIPLTIVGDVNSRAVAEHTLMLMLAAARRTVAHHSAATSGNWNERNRFDAAELDGKVLLVVGFGRIGRRVAELARAFGMTVTAHDPFLTTSELRDMGATAEVDLQTALSRADVVSLHVPGGHGPVIGPADLATMKPSAIIINAARGGLVDELALDEALRQRRLRAAALDVLAQEPPDPDHPLLQNPYITISPHNAGLTEECARRMALAAAQNILDCFDGTLNRKLVVNAAAIDMA
jgi:D-3-phosphoglycerate dehydrogenase / 2-oxoglutarate reductase